MLPIHFTRPGVRLQILLLGVALTWTINPPSIAEPVGIKTVVVTNKVNEPAFVCNDFDLVTCQVLVEFNTPQDNLLSVAFTNICASIDNQGFFQVPAQLGGSNTAPLQVLLDLFPDLRCDSFVTIGLDAVSVGQEDCTTPDPDFDSAAFNDQGELTGGWFCDQPPSGQGLAGNHQANRVLIAQFSSTFSCNVSGFVTVYYNDGTIPFEGSFQCDICEWACASDPGLCDDGNNCTIDACDVPRNDCYGCAHRNIDLDGNSVIDAADLSLALGGWGPGDGPSDFNDDGAVDALDLGLLLGNWGPCGGGL